MPNKGRQVHPEGGVVTLTPEEREQLRTLREKHGWTQGDLAKRIGVAPATISNAETGRSGQTKRSVYAKILRALRVEGTPAASPVADEIFKQMVDDASELDEGGLRTAAALIEQLKRLRQKRE